MAIPPLPRIISRKEAAKAGLKHYFTGKPCRHGHISKRFTGSFSCVKCQRLNCKEWRANHADRKREIAKVWRLRNIDRQREKERERRAKNPHRGRAATLKWRLNHPEKAREARRNWMRRNLQILRVHNHELRARRRSAEGTFTLEDIDRIRKQQRNRCADPACRSPLKKLQEHIDHIIPLFRGGSNWPNNLQLLCSRCNASKGARDPIEHARLKGRLL